MTRLRCGHVADMSWTCPCRSGCCCMTRRRASLLASCAPRSSSPTTATTRGGAVSRGSSRTTVLPLILMRQSSIRRPLSWSSYADDDWLRSPAFYEEHVGPLAGPREGKREGRPAGGRPRGGAACFERGKDLVLPPWKPPSFWRAPLSDPGLAAPGRRRGTYLFFAGELGAKRLPGYSHDLRQRAEALFCDPREPRPRRDCLEHAAGCRSDLAPNCSLWRPGVRVVPHVRRGGHRALRLHPRAPAHASIGSHTGLHTQAGTAPRSPTRPTASPCRAMAGRRVCWTRWRTPRVRAVV